MREKPRRMPNGPRKRMEAWTSSTFSLRSMLVCVEMRDWTSDCEKPVNVDVPV